MVLNVKTLDLNNLEHQLKDYETFFNEIKVLASKLKSTIVDKDRNSTSKPDASKWRLQTIQSHANESSHVTNFYATENGRWPSLLTTHLSNGDFTSSATK